MSDRILRLHLERLLSRVASSFRLDTRIGGRPLSDLIASAVARAAEPDSATWGDAGDPGRLERIVSPSLTFLYRPHLFPGMDEDLRLGHLLQYQLLPQRLPPGSPIEVAALLESYCHLSGDVFGWRAEPGGALTLWLLDISGHGLRAGFAALVLTMLLEDSEPGLDLGALAEELEARFLSAREPADPACLYATGVLLRVEPDGECRAVCAGHPPPLLRRGAHRIEELQGGSLPLGLVPGQPVRVTGTRLAPEDLVLVYSDGLIEAADDAGRLFGAERTAQILAAGPDVPADVAGLLYSEVAAHHDLSRLDDDLSFLVIRRRAS